MTPGLVRHHVNRLIRHLVSDGLVDDQQEAYERGTSDKEITFRNANLVSVGIGNQPYQETYAYFAENRVFIARMLDGALIQVTYRFRQNSLAEHRLAFLPSPNLESNDWDQELLQDGREFADIVRRNVQPVPVRFDFNSKDEDYVEIVHPKSHLTLGNYSTCRIPVTSPVAPYWFFSFIIRNFYSTRDRDFAVELPKLSGIFEATISSRDQSIPHLTVPG